MNSRNEKKHSPKQRIISSYKLSQATVSNPATPSIKILTHMGFFLRIILGKTLVNVQQVAGGCLISLSSDSSSHQRASYPGSRLFEPTSDTCTSKSLSLSPLILITCGVGASSKESAASESMNDPSPFGVDDPTGVALLESNPADPKKGGPPADLRANGHSPFSTV